MSLPLVIRRSGLALCSTYFLASGSIADEAKPIFKVYEAPGAGTQGATAQGTEGVAISVFGTTVGLMRDSNDVRHGYLRYADGSFTVFDHPDAGTDGTTLQGTKVAGINALGTVVGTYRDAQNLDHPYIREPDGHFVNIPIPNLLGGNGDSINLWGSVVGNYLNLTDVQNFPILLHYHGFVRSPSGTVTLFDPPGSTNTEIPAVGAINDSGTVTGDFWVCNSDQSACSAHGFIRKWDGSYVPFDVDGAGPDAYSGQGTFPQGINDLGEVVGYYVDTNDIGHGFVRDAEGIITVLDVPTKCTTSSPPADCAYEGTYPDSINNLGAVTGTYYGEDGNSHGFVRHAHGSIERLNVPGYSTYASAINDFGVIAGLVYTSSSVLHGLYVLP